MDNKLHICDHAKICGSKTCSHKLPHEYDELECCPSDCGLLYKTVNCINIETDWDE